ncbi:MAG: hypothetical protein US60_C0006G0026 [Microgenomates group bacterium GW2011_GWC1_37_8]|uniref:Uncharacterized protein n=1 Tax=Candidatus Woesebacteria bacterium GW2011_GWB1_38_8 TaxID=1618570 RepID=A0A0G0NGV6_9BACT|nr:MAG: hypothetical protein US60_C0006G0026 [Microgenomates group bacterium GW2011_GWC1_37_8]KKQ85099.1 MAG: hypothetical protein UT08_C0010G0026 [Candidatus Woesebacteria bacterium GW2011_GWB1_38_8]
MWNVNTSEVKEWVTVKTESVKKLYVGFVLEFD